MASNTDNKKKMKELLKKGNKKDKLIIECEDLVKEVEKIAKESSKLLKPKIKKEDYTKDERINLF